MRPVEAAPTATVVIVEDDAPQPCRRVSARCWRLVHLTPMEFDRLHRLALRPGGEPRP